MAFKHIRHALNGTGNAESMYTAPSGKEFILFRKRVRYASAQSGSVTFTHGVNTLETVEWNGGGGSSGDVTFTTAKRISEESEEATSYVINFTPTGNTSEGMPIYSGTTDDGTTWYLKCIEYDMDYGYPVYGWIIATALDVSSYYDSHWMTGEERSPFAVYDNMNFPTQPSADLDGFTGDGGILTVSGGGSPTIDSVIKGCLSKYVVSQNSTISASTSNQGTIAELMGIELPNGTWAGRGWESQSSCSEYDEIDPVIPDSSSSEEPTPEPSSSSSETPEPSSSSSETSEPSSSSSSEEPQVVGDHLVIFDDSFNELDDIRFDVLSGTTKNGQPVWIGTKEEYQLWVQKLVTYYLYAVNSPYGWVVSTTLPEEANPVWNNYSETQKEYYGNGDDEYDEYTTYDASKYGVRAEVSALTVMPWEATTWKAGKDDFDYFNEITLQSGDFRISNLDKTLFPATLYVSDNYATDGIDYSGTYSKRNDLLVEGIYPVYHNSTSGKYMYMSKTDGSSNGVMLNRRFWKFSNTQPDATALGNNYVTNGSFNSNNYNSPYSIKSDNYYSTTMKQWILNKNLPGAFAWRIYNGSSTSNLNIGGTLNDPTNYQFVVQPAPMQQYPSTTGVGTFSNPILWYENVATNDGQNMRRLRQYTDWFHYAPSAGLPSNRAGFAVYVYLVAGIEYKFGGIAGEYGPYEAGIMLCSGTGSTILASDYGTNSDEYGETGHLRKILGFTPNSFFKYTPSESGFYKLCGYTTGTDSDWENNDYQIQLVMDPAPIFGTVTQQ